MVLVHDTLSECALQMYEVTVIERTRKCDGQTQEQK